MKRPGVVISTPVGTEVFIRFPMSISFRLFIGEKQTVVAEDPSVAAIND
jgi:hypothetical protein